MKKIGYLLILCLMTGLTGYSRIVGDDVPDPVKSAFTKKFSDATEVKFERERKNFEISFKNNGDRMTANFNSKGDWLETETVIDSTDLSKEVITSIATNFPGYKIAHASQIEKPDTALIYEVVLKMGNKAYEVKFSPKGQVLRKTELRKERD